MATKLVVSDLPNQVDELQLRVLFEKYGPVAKINYAPKHSPRRATIEMSDAGSAQKAIANLNNRPYMDQKIHVTQALLGSRA